MGSSKIDAATAALSRLIQMRELWGQAADNYFEPMRFLIGIQNFIMTSRTVTFIIQANKSIIPNFENWYQPHQASLSDDRIMVWAKDTRNFIEKRGDLEPLSQVRGEIICSYYDGPFSDWVPQSLFSSARDFYLAVPNKISTLPHVVEHGTLLIERRWVDVSLPDLEILEALSHVYEKLSGIVVDLFQHLELEVPHVISEILPENMSSLAMDRAIYLSMKDGSPSGFRVFSSEMKISEKKLRKRYGDQRGKWRQISRAGNFSDLVEAYFRLARFLMLSDGYHKCFTYFTIGNRVVELLATDHPDRGSRYVLMRDLAKLAEIRGADGMFMINEAWTAREEDCPDGFAVNAKNRGESLMLFGINSKCESVCLSAEIFRKKNKTDKVKYLGETIRNEARQAAILYPFKKLWGCADEELARSLDGNKSDASCVGDIYEGLSGKISE